MINNVTNQAQQLFQRLCAGQLLPQQHNSHHSNTANRTRYTRNNNSCQVWKLTQTQIN